MGGLVPLMASLHGCTLEETPPPCSIDHASLIIKFSVNEEESSKVLEVKSKYNEIRRSLYNRRNEIIQSISDFWVTAFLSHPALVYLLSEEEHKVFKYLASLEVEDFKDVESGYSITFNFSPNPFFESTKLTKTCSFSGDGTTNITSTAIEWKDDKNITDGSAQEKKGAKRLFTEDGFFSWFGEAQQRILPTGVTDEVATIIREELWSDPLKYFNNEADEEDLSGDSSNDDANDHDDENKVIDDDEMTEITEEEEEEEENLEEEEDDNLEEEGEDDNLDEEGEDDNLEEDDD